MGIIRNRTLISRNKQQDNRVYVPADSRDNQYVIAELAVNDALVAQLSDKTLNPSPKELLSLLLNKVRRIVANHEIDFVALIASNKFIRVRYGVDNEINTTNEQHIVYYNPEKSKGVVGVCADDANAIHSFRLVCFATGENLRENAALFHQKVVMLVNEIKAAFSFVDAIKLQDHQHISFGLEKHSSATQSKAHGFRVIEKRYESSGLTLPQERNSKAFIVVKANFGELLSEKVLNHEYDVSQMHGEVSHLLIQLAQEAGISHLAYVASNRYPVVKSNLVSGSANQNGELVSLNFGNTEHEVIQLIDDDYINSNAYLVFYMPENCVVKAGYAAYINKVIKLIDKLGQKLHLAEHDKAMLLRFYQHFSYKA
ncbi:DUF3083 family protein [Pseudoalteromonas sp. MMG024]|uniref:DUF3083 family protein n=1 Tax=Pseudoalteromonas sp. MMG024 TaxID=2909980 RepID=UPI001F2AF00C|nr:DUF3083 family protein [Pseudoalteromonas sp. MMG024]MCF6455396.1 DUF3083 family protein [Pseudoalteromonas sp. MMG024]